MRCSSAEAFLRPAESLPNLDVVTGAHVTRLQLEPSSGGGGAARRCTGVHVQLHGAARSVPSARRRH
jgi:choline dehydrogenase-like flavoprotein